MNHANTAFAPAPSPSTDELPPLRILLAEPEPRLRAILGCIFRSDGHEVVAVSDAGELLEEIAALLLDSRRPRFDLIIVAQRLPGIPGLSVLAGLRARNQTTPFILMTGDAAAQTRARRLGGVVLDRPAKVGDVRAAVRAAAALAAAD